MLTYLFGHYNLLQVLALANLRRHTSRAVAAWRHFRIPTVLRFSSTCLAQRWETVLVCDNHHLAQIRRLYELGWSHPNDEHYPAIEDAVFLYATSISSYKSYSPWFHRMRHSPLTQNGLEDAYCLLISRCQCPGLSTI